MASYWNLILKALVGNNRMPGLQDPTMGGIVQNPPNWQDIVGRGQIPSQPVPQVGNSIPVPGPTAQLPTDPITGLPTSPRPPNILPQTPGQMPPPVGSPKPGILDRLGQSQGGLLGALTPLLIATLGGKNAGYMAQGYMGQQQLQRENELQQQRENRLGQYEQARVGLEARRIAGEEEQRSLTRKQLDENERQRKLTSFQTDAEQQLSFQSPGQDAETTRRYMESLARDIHRLDERDIAPAVNSVMIRAGIARMKDRAFMVNTETGIPYPAGSQPKEGTYIPAQTFEEARGISSAIQGSGKAGKPTMHPVTIEDPVTKGPVPAIQMVNPDGSSKVYLGNAEVPNPKIYNRPSVALLNRDEMMPVIDRVARALAGVDAKGNPIEPDATSVRQIASLRGDQRLILYDKIKQYNPQYNTAQIDRKIKMLDWVQNGKGADQIQSYNTFLDHAGALADVIGDAQLSATPAFNKPLNWIRANATGNPIYSRMLVALEAPKKEFETFLLNNRALYAEDRISADRILSENSSPKMILAALNQMGHTAQARSNEINMRYKRVMKSDIEDLYSPEAMEAARKIGLDLTSGKGETIPEVGGIFRGGKVLKVTKEKD